ncbi:MAG: DUF3618 domain-containing protein [Rhodococcus sp. (in: high G+C Gram-positive bacteria)]
MSENEPKHALRDETGEHAAPSVEQQRQELADTVEALAAKVDVPARVSAAAHDQSEKVQEAAQGGVAAVKENPQVAGASLAGVAIALVLVAVVRRRRARKAARQSVLDILAGR